MFIHTKGITKVHINPNDEGSVDSFWALFWKWACTSNFIIGVCRSWSDDVPLDFNFRVFAGWAASS